MMHVVTIRRLIHVSGLVQGVGFRPFVYRLAEELKLTGLVRNTAAGVEIEAQGEPDSVETFLARLQNEAPPLSKILDVVVEDLDCADDNRFRILESCKEQVVRTLISPDVSICNDCLREMLDPNDRRFRYPFINCTHCGPRFTIVRNIPYDRPGTSMAKFSMCAACRAEYDDPRSRRFHAQPNACWDCGPKLELWSGRGTLPAHRDPIHAAIDLLRTGCIGAIKGLGGFHLAVDALNEAAVSRLREGKRRIEKPFAVMVPDLKTAEEFCEIDEAECEALQSFQRPIVLLRKKQACAIPDGIAARNRDLGIFLPYTPMHHLLFREGGFKALVMTSGNVSEEPIAIHNNEARERLYGLADFFLLHDRDILLRCDDSVVRVEAGQVQQLRRSRGFVPAPVLLHKPVPAILAMGGELNNTICLAAGSKAFLSQHVGDIETLSGYGFLLEAIDHLRKILEIEPEMIAYDLHPDYLGTKWALRQTDKRLMGVQHHHAHIASCMAENHLDGPVIGFALDGTGYGADGHIWGGEVLIADYTQFTRAAHLEYVPMPGGAMAVREPWRMAVSYLTRFFGAESCKMKLPPFEHIDLRKIDLAARMVAQGVNAPLTSSCGRLFDAVASIAGVRQQVNYQGQAAIELEALADACPGQGSYPFELQARGECFVIGTKPMFQALVNDVLDSVAAGIVSARFHSGLVDILARTARLVRARTGLHRVCLSGGTFNNKILLRKLTAALKADGIEVFVQGQVPCGDGGLSLGQAVIAAHRYGGGEANSIQHSRAVHEQRGQIATPAN